MTDGKDLLRKIRLGADRFLELKVVFAGGRIQGPGRGRAANRNDDGMA